MKKLFLCMALVAGAIFTSCSSDEPTSGIEPDNNGSRAYIAVNIKDVNTGATAKPSSRATDPDQFAYGDANEHAVTSARFFFFDANGIFVAEANIWKGGKEVDPADKNVEYMGNNVLVLKGIKDKSALKYMITVLNAPDNLSPLKGSTNINEFSKTTLEAISRTAQIDGNQQQVFFMSTSSFIPNAADNRYNSKYYFANQLNETDFVTVAEDAQDVDLTGLTPINVYVERLAAKVTMAMPANTVEITMTVAGADPNNNINPDGTPGVAATKLYIKFENWGISSVAPKTFLSKQLSGTTDNYYFAGWNEPERYRSYWAESYQYGLQQDLVHKTYAELALNGAPINKPAYEKETVNTVDKIVNAEGKLLQNKVANVLLTATVYSDAACTQPVDLVYFQGLYYTKNHYMDYALNALKANLKLNFYKKSGDTMQQVSRNDIKFVTASANTNGNVLLAYAGGDADQLYALKAGAAGTDFDNDYEAKTPADLNAVLAAFNQSADAMAYTGGKMFYNIPVEHLVSAPVAGVALGQYGLVRNHWYNITVGKVLNLGKGVFDPDNQTLNPGDDTDNSKFGLVAQINILSWRLVNQNVDL